ncbi:SusC/RagA family TonB-linked outer membrane protein [Sphingobacterium tabacisoli]|uniref:SusC/RagA family TonB-linked outer membrane protein n=1 Tax=Sphingobacterium tabacisoli TaxID=2044855 RepID=A0ABW5KZ55_9SPHI|nr:TonB-dependent receptor [Sphingobacterium tabacisoli]
MKQKLLSLFFVLTCLIGVSMAQNRQVSGKVTSATDGAPLSGVSVSVVGTSTATQTDGSGNYSISVGQGGALNFSFIGYSAQRVAVGNRNSINVQLISEDNALEEVVVTGYGTQTKREVTGSIASIKGEVFKDIASPSIDKSLQGQVAGVQASSVSGLLGQPAKIRIRGTSSISSSSDPLYVVDGVPYITGDKSQVFTNNPLSDINPTDILSVEILKDGAATAIYGSRASAGVILITTKKGQSGAPKLTYDNWFASAAPSKYYSLLNAKEFIEIANEKTRNIGETDDYAFPTIDPISKEEYDIDWQRDVAFRRAFQHNHAISLSGATEKTNYYFSGGYTDLKGVSVGNSQRKYNVRGRVEQKAINDKLTLGINTNVVNTTDYGFNNSDNGLSGNMGSALYALPNVPIKWADGTYNISADGSALGPGANLLGIHGNYTNLKYTLDHNIYKSARLNFNGNAFANIELLKGLDLKTTVGVQYLLGEDYMYYNPVHGDGRSVNGRIYQYFIPNLRYNWQNTLSYNRTFGEHKINAIVGTEYQKSSSRYFFAHGTDLSSTYFAENENIISGSLTNQLLGGGATENSLYSLFGRANYVFLDRYFVSGTLRYDRLSALPFGSQGAVLPGVSVGWDIAKEEFFTSSLISQFKLRGGYAKVGNTEIGNYPYAGLFSAKLYGDYTGIDYSQAGNPDLKFETSKKINIGLDLAFLNDRLSFTADYFKNDIDNMILAVLFAPSLGIPDNEINMNVGRMSNKGFEFTLGGLVIDKGNFKWSSNVNATFVKNRIEKLVDGKDITYPYTINREGQSIGSFYGYQFAGVNTENGAAIYEKSNGTFVQNIGSGYKVYDPNNKGDISKNASLGAADKRLLGNSSPTWYGGFNNTFSYKNLDLNIFVSFSGGNKIYNKTRQESLNNQNFANGGKEQLDRWTTVGQNTNVPKLVYGAGNAMNLDGSLNSRFLENGNFLRAQNIGLAYTFGDEVFLRNLYINKLKIFAQVQNAFVITKYTGLDPEAANSFETNSQANSQVGIDIRSNPVPRTFTVGINVGF